MSINWYEVKRRWRDFREDFRKNRWYRNRIIAYFILAMVVACNLAHSVFGWSKLGIISGIVLGWVYFRSYERCFSACNGGSLAPLFRLGLLHTDMYLLMPSLTIAFSCFVELAWLRFSGPWWLWFLLLYGLSQLLRLIDALKTALQLLAQHESYASNAQSFLHFATSRTNPARRAFELLHDWVKDITGEDIDLSNVDIYKIPPE